MKHLILNNSFEIYLVECNVRKNFNLKNWYYKKYMNIRVIQCIRKNVKWVKQFKIDFPNVGNHDNIIQLITLRQNSKRYYKLSRSSYIETSIFLHKFDQFKVVNDLELAKLMLVEENNNEQ